MQLYQRLLAIAATVACSFGAIAQALQPPASERTEATGPKNLQEALTRGFGAGAAQMKQVKRLPVNGLSIVELTDGRSFVVSDNGRLAVIGRILDLWEGTTITNIQESASLDKINLARMGIKPQDLTKFSIGNGPKQVFAFVDPLCEPCRKIVSDMNSYAKTHTFHIIIAPFSGSQAGLAARQLHCSPDKKLAIQALISGSMVSLPEAPRDCDVESVQKAMITSMVLGIKVSPFLILPDNTTVSGQNVQLSQALKQ